VVTQFPWTGAGNQTRINIIESSSSITTTEKNEKGVPQEFLECTNT
jgi:hypothetical protein